MEENGALSKGNNLKDYKPVWKSTNKPIITYMKSTTENGIEDGINGEERFGEFSWPPKSYTCSFCKREFRSAQALGGHMNVHRREKAKLRQINVPRYLSFLHPQAQLLDQNPNPNVTTSCVSSNTSSFPTMHTPFTYSCCFPHVLCVSNVAKAEAKPRNSDEGVIVKKTANGLPVDPKFDDLDLELRLGCS